MIELLIESISILNFFPPFRTVCLSHSWTDPKIGEDISDFNVGIHISRCDTLPTSPSTNPKDILLLTFLRA